MDIDQETATLIKIEETATLIKTENDPFTIDIYLESSYQDSEDIKPLCTDVSVEILSVEPHCLNCGCDISQKRRHKVARASVEVMAVIRQWIAPQLIGEDDQICHSCFIISLRERNVKGLQEVSNGRRRQLCVTCQCSLIKKRSHTLDISNERMMGIRNLVIEEIAPRQLSGTDQLCHPCWQKYDRKCKSPPPEPKNLPSVIYLPNITRPADTQACCFYPNCQYTERRTIPRWLRVKLFTDYKFYISFNCKICSYHLANHDWNILKSYPNPIHMFTTDHIEDFASFVNERYSIIDFNNIEEMGDETVKYWTGLTKEQFRNVYATLPQLKNKKNGQVGLAGYLMKLKTGDPTHKIANLLNVSRSTLSRMMDLARNVLQNLPDDVVAQEIGNDINNDDSTLNADGQE